jgi:chorismate mutase
MELKPFLGIREKRPFLIAGPCSAETEGQVMSIAQDLAKQGNISLFRSGIWKPRTRPGSFEGVGSEGLKWLKRVKEETGLKTTVEVANAHHVYEALKFGVDVLWIGARTTVNPFSVQEIADALRGCDIPVMVKNPINPDLELWIGAFERLNKSGITQLAAIHRGFSSHAKSQYRNVPHFEYAIELMRRFPDLPIIGDNSHICGNRHMLQEVAQQMMDLNFDGLITEVHCNPDEAWSDAKQQVTPDRYKEMMGDIVIRAERDAGFLTSIEAIRVRIDEVDNEILSLLGRRMGMAQDIGRYKKRNNISILQPERWNEILNTAVQKGSKHDLSDEFVIQLLSAIHQESIRHQTIIMKSADAEVNGKEAAVAK